MSNIEKCEFMHIHDEVVDSIKDNMIDNQKINELGELYKVFGDPTRLKILYILSKHEVCVCDLASILSMTQSAISHQLKVLKDAKLIKFRKQGKSVFYSLLDNHVEMILNMGIEHIEE